MIDPIIPLSVVDMATPERLMSIKNNYSKLLPVNIGAIILLLSFSGSLFGHASLEQETAKSGDNYRGVLRITHGCSGSPTVAVRVRIPDGVKGTKPMAKAGWELETIVMKLDEPYTSRGTTVTEDVRELIWKGGSLADDFFDEFVFRATLPDTTEKVTLYFRTVQECENGEFHRWIEVPMEGENGDDFQEPAPALNILPGDHTL
jgi:periplasmic copper chaperone A